MFYIRFLNQKLPFILSMLPVESQHTGNLPHTKQIAVIISLFFEKYLNSFHCCISSLSDVNSCITWWHIYQTHPIHVLFFLTVFLWTALKVSFVFNDAGASLTILSTLLENTPREKPPPILITFSEISRDVYKRQPWRVQFSWNLCYGWFIVSDNKFKN